MYHNEYVRMIPNGEVYAIRVRDEDHQIIGACGPLHHSEVAPSLLRDIEYDAELAEWLNSADFAQPDPLYRLEPLSREELIAFGREHALRLLRESPPVYVHLMELMERDK